MFQPVYQYFKKIANSDHILEWKSKELSDESTKLSAASDNSLATALNHTNTKFPVKFVSKARKTDIYS